MTETNDTTPEQPETAATPGGDAAAVPTEPATDAPAPEAIANPAEPEPAEAAAVPEEAAVAEAAATPEEEAPAEPQPAPADPAAEAPAAEPSPTEAAAAPEPAEAAPAETAPAPAEAAVPEPTEAAVPEPAVADDATAAPAPAAAAPAPVPSGPPPKPGEEGYDPDQGLGLPDAAAPLGTANLGGFESGEIVTGTVLTVTAREVEVDLGSGRVGVITDRHWSSGEQVDLTSVAKTGDSVEAAVLVRADVKQRITLSHLWARQKRGWTDVEEAAKAKGDVEATVTETVRGGVSVDVNGIRGFMPASLADLTTVSDLKPLVGQTFAVRVIEADRTKQRLIVSRKAAMRANQRQQAKQALNDIKVGQTMTGKVAQITDFGAFVDVEGVRGLLHKSEIGWSRARDPQRELTVGQEVEVTVIKVQPSRNRLGLTMKSGDDPLKSLKRGARFEGAVTRLVDFGAFVALPGGVEGLVHVSEMAEYRVFAPEEIVIPGEKVWVKVLKVDRKRRTVDLSMAQAVVPDPPDEEAALAAEASPSDGDAGDAATAEAPATDDDYAEDQADTSSAPDAEQE